MRDEDRAFASAPCAVLTVPGLCNSGPDHWQTAWDARFADDPYAPCRRVELGGWDAPDRAQWTDALDRAIRAAAAGGGRARPVILVAHSLGCLAVAWWAQGAGDAARLVAGALLVAPPATGRCLQDARLAGFAPPPRDPLPFPAVLVASRNDSYATFDAARELAVGWGARLIDAGAVGHINAASALGDWPFGRLLLTGLIHRVAPAREARLPARAPHRRNGWAQARRRPDAFLAEATSFADAMSPCSTDFHVSGSEPS